ncbi:MAG: ribonuclease III [Clostridiales bacterium]|nr:ribonuclease III [Clostridiales bacterium]
MVSFEEKIGYTFKDRSLLQTALSHSSYTNERTVFGECNERLEFLGDSVLGFVTAEYYYKTLSGHPEGELTKLRAATVCEKTLFTFAQQIGLGSQILLGKGEELTGGRNRPSVLSDAFEAVIAAIYLDGGIEAARKFIIGFIENWDGAFSEEVKDYKTLLQEDVQRFHDAHLEYNQTAESGPDHSKTFFFEVTLNGERIGEGSGRSKKLAEQQAAKAALEKRNKK